MDHQARLTAAQRKRDTVRAAKVKRERDYREAAREGGQVRLFTPPAFDPANMIDPHLFRGDQHGQPQRVHLEHYENASDNRFDEDYITFQRKRATEPVSEYRSADRITVTDVPPEGVWLQMPAELMQDEGVFDFRFEVAADRMDTAWSAPVQIMLDWTPPIYPQIPGKAIFPFAADFLVTDDYLAKLPGGVLKIQIPAYDWREGDGIAWAWINDFPDEIVPPLPGEVHEQLSADLVVEIPISIIRTLGEGTGRHRFVYTLYDRALNTTHTSISDTVRVALLPIPEPLPVPEVPLAADTLEYADLALDVEVEIGRIPNGLYSDDIVVTWGSTELEPLRLMNQDPLPHRVRVPPAILKAEWTAGGGDGLVKTNVSYAIHRQRHVFPGPVITVDVDFSTVGPVNPEWPEPVNPDLETPTIRSASGNENQILAPDDVGQPATAHFKLYDPVNSGEIIQLYWDGVAVEPAYEVPDGALPGDDLSIQIPWELILASGNHGELPVWYSIRSAEGINEQFSGSQRVLVDITAIVLKVATLPQTSGAVTCNTLYLDGGRIHVKVEGDGQYIVEGTEVRVHWEGYERILEDGEPVRGDNIAGTNGIFTFTWAPDNQIAVISPAEVHVLPISPRNGEGNDFGYCYFWYEIDNGGRTLKSIEDWRIVGLGSGSGFCPWPAPKP